MQSPLFQDAFQESDSGAWALPGLSLMKPVLSARPPHLLGGESTTQPLLGSPLFIYSCIHSFIRCRCIKCLSHPGTVLGAGEVAVSRQVPDLMERTFRRRRQTASEISKYITCQMVSRAMKKQSRKKHMKYGSGGKSAGAGQEVEQ